MPEPTVTDLPPVAIHVDGDGREFGFVHVRHPGATGLAVHFSAFFGAWGDARPYRDQFQGYFHRLKMLGGDPSRNWLFLCDAHGAFDNGTYYTGRAGDLFVERAMTAIIEAHRDEFGYRGQPLVTLGSSMGATAALKFGLDLDADGIVAICPHVDLDVCAARQDRMAEVAWICPDGDPLAPHNHRYTRQIRERLEARPPDRPLPRLFVQSCEDDAGVHDEQVVPLVGRWRARGGDVTTDFRPSGGHTSDWATRAVLLDAVACLAEDRPVDVVRYRDDPAFAGRLVRPPMSHRLRRAASLARKRVLGAAGRGPSDPGAAPALSDPRPGDP